MNFSTIRQTIWFETSAQKMYDMIMNADLHAAFTGSFVSMSNAIEGKFEVFDGYCRGYNIELVNGKKIVQAWHFEEEGWPEDHFTICTFNFKDKNQKTCELEFIQENIPSHLKDALEKGWQNFYWEPIKKYIETDE